MFGNGTDFEEFPTVSLYPNEILFNDSERILISGNSASGKTYLLEQLVKKYHRKFHKIIISGSKNKLLTFPETKLKTTFFQGHSSGSDEEDIFNPFLNYDEINHGNKESLQILLIYDDLMETILKSPIISKLFSQGRHFNLSSIVLIQTYFPKYKSIDYSVQIKK